MVENYREFDFPVELCCQPACLIGLVGLDVHNNLVHKNLWDAFNCDRRSDGRPLNFALLPFGHSFPPSKPKKASYEWYIPKGILKTNWMYKHSKLLPSLVVIFYELDWDDPNFSDKKLDCASYVHSTKTTTESRNTKIALVLIQKNVPLLAATIEENLSLERAADALCATCEITRNSLLLLNLTDHLEGYIVRLENAFYELAQSYYQQEIRNIKLHNDHLSKSAHQYLLIRHQFKIAFLNELKQDFHNARKHYNQALSNLAELRICDANIFEIKVISAYIVYKYCKLSFALNQPRDAISSFATHIQRFKNKTGPEELLFEHYAWLSRQFSVFGELFDEATKHGLPAVQTKHPGFYFEEAAEYAIRRKKYIQSENFQNVLSYPEPDPLIGWDTVEYFGHRPWRCNKQTLEAADVAKEQIAYLALQYRDKFIVNHSIEIIAHFSNAIIQFKSYRSPRKRRHLVVMMADEYCDSKDYGKALTLLTHMIWEYRSDRWWSIVLHLIKNALMCAYLTASIAEYVQLSLEAVCLLPTPDEQIQALKNFHLITQGVHPEYNNSNLLDHDLLIANQLWSNRLQSVHKNLTIDMDSISSFIQCKARFLEANSDIVKIEILFRNLFRNAIKFSQLSIVIGCSNRVMEGFIFKEDLSVQDSFLEFKPDVVFQFQYQFIPSACDIGTDLKINSIILIYGSDVSSQHPIILKFAGVCKERGDKLDCDHLLSNRILYKEVKFFFNTKSVLNIRVEPKISLIDLMIDHKPPNLLSEWYPITFQIRNNESSVATDCKIRISLNSTSELNRIVEMTDISDCIGNIIHQIPFDVHVPDIAPDVVVTKIIYIRTRSIDTRDFTFKVYYKIENISKERISCTKEETVSLNCVNVFEVTASFLSIKCQYIDKLYAEEPIIMTTQVDCVSPWPIIIQNTNFKLNDSISWCPKKYESQLRDCCLQNGEIGAEAVSLNIPQSTADGSPISLGIFSIFWRRKDMPDEYTTCTNIQLPQVQVNKLPLYIDVTMPTPGFDRTPLTLSLRVHNRSDEMLSFTISIEHNDAFMLSGNKQEMFNTLPKSSQYISYNLFPLNVGLLTLPRIDLKLNSDFISQEDISDLLKRTLPSTLFVLVSRSILEMRLGSNWALAYLPNLTSPLLPAQIISHALGNITPNTYNSLRLLQVLSNFLLDP